jgi:hypothetical protein
MMSRVRVRSAVVTTLAGTAVAFVASSVFAAPIAMANPVCAGADVTGSLVSPHQPPLVCVPTSLSTLCATPEAGLGSTVEVSVVLCVPV